MPESERAVSERKRSARPKRESATDASASESGSHDGTRRKTTKSSSSHRLSGRRAAARAAHHVSDLAGKDLEAVTSLEETEQGWMVGIEVVETHRIPDSTDILAVYLVEVDDAGELISFRRAKRHYRGRAEKSDA